MTKFVFRNNTVERFFGKEYAFSGYDDISRVPQEAEGYVWWYQLPVKYEQEALAAEVQGYAQKLDFVLRQVDGRKTFIALTMDIGYNVPFTDDDHRVRRAVDDYNHVLYDRAAAMLNVKVVDITEFSRRYAAAELMDWKFYFISQAGMNPKLHKEFKAWFERKIDGIALRRKKCVALDLDNTLWGGVLGEEGIDGIRIGGDYPGKAFLYFQESLLQLSRSGVLLAVCSKNNEQDVLEAWEKNPFILLRKEAFAARRINWDDKATNLRALAAELNIGLDSFVFVDDSPTERELIRQTLPMVCVPDFPTQPYELPLFFRQMVEDYFKVYTVTDEDKAKTAQYKANAARAQAQQCFADFDKFLESLDIRLVIEGADEFNIPRIAQMTQKTNQFNLTTRRYTDADLRGFAAQGWRIWCISVADKFGDSGITGALMVHGDEIDSLLLSCRILGKGIEKAFLKTILVLLRKMGLSSLKALYIPSAKNAQVKDFYEQCGFACTGTDNDGSKLYVINLATADLTVKDYYHITLK